MHRLSRRCQYAVRAVTELAREHGGPPVSTAMLARRQAIPRRFLEQILCQLREAGLVRSRAGRQGGYTLIPAPDELSIGRVIRLFGCAFRLVDCRACGGDRPCRLETDCGFARLWHMGTRALSALYDQTTFADLIASRFEAAIGLTAQAC